MYIVVPSHDRAAPPVLLAMLFTRAPRFTGVAQGSAVVSRVDTQISVSPVGLVSFTPPGRVEDTNISSPSRRIAVRPSLDVLLSSGTRTADPNSQSSPRVLA